MRKEMPIQSMIFFVALSLPAMAFAESSPKTAPIIEQSNITWSAATGLGYDSNVYQAPSASYIDYAPATPVLVTPQSKTGFFVPYEAKVDAVKNQNQDSRLQGSASADGRLYPGAGMSNANEYNVSLNGGYEHVLGRDGKSENTIYVGALAGQHKQVYVDHDTGLGKTSTVTGADISGRYSYISTGAEAEYKHRTGKIDYGFNGQLVINNYENPVAGSPLDHTYYTLGADASFPVAAETKLNMSIDHSVRDYSKLHSRDALGNSSIANPLLVYTYDAVGATLRNRISPEWLLYLDVDHTQRADGYVNYNDYKQNRYGVRVIYEQGSLKARLAFHHWVRDYPNGFAFDAAGQGAKTYSGNDLKFKAEFEQTKNTSLWAELVYDAQNATDLRYDYVRTLVMAGMSWAY